MAYNAANTRHIRQARRAAAQAERDRAEVITRIMSSPAGRFYFYDRLIRCHIFETTFTNSGLVSAFAEGERNIGLQDQIDIMRYCPDQYIAMFREAADREQANARRTDDTSSVRPSRDREDSNGDDSGPGDELVDRDYDPGDADRDEA